MIANMTQSKASVPPAGHPSPRQLAGLFGILIAAIMAGLNNRVGALALGDVRGALGFSLDDASWVSTAYSAGELIAMPFAAWFAITLSIRRFTLWMLGSCTLMALVMPSLHALPLLLSLRFTQGLVSGSMIPVLMMAALKFLPASIRLYGLALYALTATFAPNLSIWLTGIWVDTLFDWRWVYWQVIPLSLLAGLLVAWGLPREPVQRARFKNGNWSGLMAGAPALGLLAIALDQGGRLDWFSSPLIVLSLANGLVLLGIYLMTEWYHSTPFIRPQLLVQRRNLGLGFTIFVLLLVALTSASFLPVTYLSAIHHYRPLQMACIGLIIALPQIVFGFVVALFLYPKWIDARKVFTLGLILVAASCFLGASLTSEWNHEQFLVVQLLQALGQPMAVVSMLFLGTSVVQPAEGPYVSGTINALRALGTMLGVAVVGQFVTVRGRFHNDVLIGRVALHPESFLIIEDPGRLTGVLGQQALVLSIADAYLMLGLLALLLIPFVLSLTHISAPEIQPSKATALS